MADSKSKPPASIYSSAAQMAMSGQGAGAAGGGSKSGSSQANQGEKVKNIQTLLEVFKKMDMIEDDPDAKQMIQSMSETAQKYLDKIQGKDSGAGTGVGKPAASASADGAAPTSAAGADMGGGGTTQVPA